MAAYIYLERYISIYMYFYNYISISIYLSLYVYMYIYLYVYICSRFKRKMEAQANFFNPFTVCSSCKRKSFVCKRTKRTKPIFSSMKISYLYEIVGHI